jgi:hypothetical protein
MDNKVLFAGGALACLGTFAAMELYEASLRRQDAALMMTLPAQIKAQEEQTIPDQPETADGVIAWMSARVEEGTPAERLDAAEKMIEALESPMYQTSSISKDAGEVMAHLLGAAAALEGASEELKTKTAGVIAARGSGPAAREHVMKVLREGPQEARVAVLSGVGRPGGVRGKSVYEALLETASIEAPCPRRSSWARWPAPEAPSPRARSA